MNVWVMFMKISRSRSNFLPVRNFPFSRGSQFIYRAGVDLAKFHEFKCRWRINLWRLSCFPFSPHTLDGKCRIYLILFLLSAEKCGIYLKPFVFGWFILFMKTSHYSGNDFFFFLLNIICVTQWIEFYNLTSQKENAIFIFKGKFEKG